MKTKKISLIFWGGLISLLLGIIFGSAILFVLGIVGFCTGAVLDMKDQVDDIPDVVIPQTPDPLPGIMVHDDCENPDDHEDIEDVETYLPEDYECECENEDECEGE